MRPPQRHRPAAAAAADRADPGAQLAVYAWAPGQESALAALTGALRAHGVSVEPYDPHGTHDRARPLLILLSDALVSDRAQEIDALAGGWDGPLIPIRPTDMTHRLPTGIDNIAPVFSDPGAPENQAERIALALRVAPEHRLAWLELQARAERHRDEDGGRSELLSAGERARALETISTRQPDVIPDVPEQIKGLVDDSTAALARAARTRRTLGLSAAVLLAVLALVALIQRHSADDAVNAAHAAQLGSESDRLSRLATQQLATNPDLPVLLARRAYRLDADSGSGEALRRALDATPAHRSYRLPGTPASLATSPSSPDVAVVLTDGTVAVIDSRDGRTLARIPSPPHTGGVAIAAISPDGRTLALAYNGGLIQLRGLTDPAALLRSRHLRVPRGAESLSLAWVPGSPLLLSAWSEGPALALDSASGAVHSILPATPTAALAAAPDGRLAALLGADRLTIFKTSTMRPCSVQQETSAGAGPVLFDAAQPMVLLITASGLPLQAPIPRACEAPGAAKLEEPALPAASGARAASVLPDGSYAIGTAFGKIMIFTPPSVYAAASFPAHTAAVAGTGTTLGGTLVSVGGDGWLRVWQLQDPAPAYPVGAAAELSLDEGLSATAAPATWRPLLALTSTGEAVGAGPSTGSLWLAPAADPGRPTQRYFMALESSIRPAGDGCHVLMITGAGGVTEYRCAGERLTVTWRRNTALQGANNDSSAISADGQWVALAASGEVELTRTATNTSVTAHTEELQSIAFDQADQLIGVQGSGMIITLTATGHVTDTPVQLQGESVRVAGVAPSGKQVLLATSAGRVTLADRATGRVRARLSIPAALTSAIDVRFSPDGRLAVILARDGYWVIDIPQWRVIASGDEFNETEPGSQPRDGAFLPGDRTLLILRADEGIQTVPLAPWRFLDGPPLLTATAPFTPRALAAGETGEPQAIPSAGE